MSGNLMLNTLFAFLSVSKLPAFVFVALFLHNLFRVDFDVNSRLGVSRFDIIDADTQARFVYCLSS